MSVEFDSSRLTIVDHPLVQHKLHILRDEATGTNQFRALVRELVIALMAYAMWRVTDLLM